MSSPFVHRGPGGRMRAADLIRWAATMPVPSGDNAGESWTVPPWQRRLLAAIVKPGVQVIAATCGRGNGKTAVAALISRAYLPGGPLYEPGAEVLVVSASHPQARLVIDDLEAWREDGWLVANSPQIARVKAGRAQVRAVAANPRTLHGARPSVIVADELTQWQSPERMYAALRTSLGKRPGSRMLCIGTRPMSGSGHVFDRLLSGGAEVVLSYSATTADDEAGRLGQRRTWRKANPSLDVLPSLEASIRAEWLEARDDPQALARFKSLRLNMGVSDTSEAVLLPPEAWERIETHSLPPRDGPMVLGLDLGGTGAFTAACGFWPSSGRLEALATCGGIPDLIQRGRTDQVGGLYVAMHKAGELLPQAGRRVPDYGQFLGEVLGRWGPPSVIVCDRYREGELRDALDSARMPPGRPVIARGGGWRDGGEDLRRFVRMVMERQVSAPVSLLLRSAIGEARTLADPGGNLKLAKNSQSGRRLRARDDIAAAAILAIAEADRRGVPSERRGLRLVAV